MNQLENEVAWKESLEEAISYLDQNPWRPKNNSTEYDVLYKGKLYPPKIVYGKAIDFYEAKYPDGRIPVLTGGTATNEFLKKMGLKIISKFESLNIDNHKLYKFSMGGFLKDPKFRQFNIVERLEADNIISMHENTAKGQGNLFIKDLQVNDFVYITYGKDKLGALCRIKSDIINLPSDIEKDVNEEGYKGRYIDIIKQPVINNTKKLTNDKRGWLPSGYTTIYPINDLNDANRTLFNKYYNINIESNQNHINHKNVEDIHKPKKDINDPLNQILYGPPGTGKTYSTINSALKLLGEDVADLKREDVKKIFQTKYDEGQIVFTTFHQSMSYEDFIEGIKPLTRENDVVYEVKDGLFKSLCKKSSEKRQSTNFDEAYSKFIEDVIGKGSIQLVTPTQKKPFNIRINNNENAVAIPQTEKATEMGITKSMLREYVVNGIIKDWKPYTTAIGEYLKEQYKITVENTDNESKNYILIIDEINRGNVSQIFGELITLLEEDKRIGKDEALEVTLPYSKEKFGVPPNLYIIGTMNTADRSVEALDTALRRRFSFTEMMPKPELLQAIQFNGFTLNEVLTVVNSRIEVLLDRDHAIGHSYFMKVNSNDTKALANVFKNCIIPLLQEYFYHDYEKIALILGEGFITVNSTKDIKFAAFPKGIDNPETTNRFELITNITGDNIENAVLKLLNKNEQQ